MRQTTPESDSIAPFVEGFKSVVIATVDQSGCPFCSYAPFVRFEHCYYIFISDLAKHTKNINDNPTASIQFIEDEGRAENIFARKRISLSCRVEKRGRETSIFGEVAAQFRKKFDPRLFGMIESLGDFNLYRLEPFEGEAVFGFGRAYDITGAFTDRLVARKTGAGRKV